jgi:hypothetical protein
MPRLEIAWPWLMSGRHPCSGDIEISHVPPDGYGRSSAQKVALKSAAA